MFMHSGDRLDLALSFRRLEYGCHNPGKDKMREERGNGRRGRRIAICKRLYGKRDMRFKSENERSLRAMKKV